MAWAAYDEGGAPWSPLYAFQGQPCYESTAVAAEQTQSASAHAGPNETPALDLERLVLAPVFFLVLVFALALALTKWILVNC